MVRSRGLRHPRRLLLVDDCVAVRDLYELALAPAFQVLTAGRGADALALAVSERPDVVVLDVMMPDMDGWETCSRLKSSPRTADIPVVLLTSADDHDLFQHARAVGAAAVLGKPCPADQLLSAIRDALAASATPIGIWRRDDGGHTHPRG